MKQYEVTFIVDPVLSNEEIESTSKSYQDLVTNEGCSIINVDRIGLKQLAYPINKRSSGVYYCVEFNGESGAIVPKMELALRRDERIMRFLTVHLDKYGIKYNEDKRAGKIGTVKKEKKEEKKEPYKKPYKKGGDKAAKAAPAPEAKPAPAPEAKPIPTPDPTPAIQATPATETKPAPVATSVAAAAPVAVQQVAKSEEE